MNVFGKVLTLARNFGHVRHSLATLAGLYAGDGMMDALGGLTDREIDALADWAREADVVVEIGTLFGFTARELARRFGVTQAVDEAFGKPRATAGLCWLAP